MSCSATELFELISSNTDNVQTDAPQYFSPAASDSDYFRQGDVYVIHRDALPSDIIPMKNADPQLAPGTTKGSRHILDSLDGVEMFVRTKPNAIQGPLMKISQERTITHPEHGNIILAAGCSYEISYQVSHAEELKRMQD